MMLVMMMTTPRIIRPNDDNADNDSMDPGDRGVAIADTLENLADALGNAGEVDIIDNVNYFELKSFD